MIKKEDISNAIAKINSMEAKKELTMLYEREQICRTINFLIHERTLDTNLSTALTYLKKRIINSILTFIVDDGGVSNGL